MIRYNKEHAYKRREFTEVREGQEKHVEQSQRREYGCGVERMIESVDHKGEDAGEGG